MTKADFSVTITGTYPTAPNTFGGRGATISTTVAVPQTTAANARYALFIKPSPLNGLGRKQGLRYHNGRLYTPLRVHSDNTTPGTNDFPSYVTKTYLAHPDWDENEPDTAAQHTRIAQIEYGYYLVIDGVVWVEIGEPRYIVEHHISPTGETDPTTGGLTFALTFEDHEAVPGHHFFRADQFEDAFAHASQLTHKAGDMIGINYLARNRAQLDQIEVVNPESVTLVVPSAAPNDVQKWQQDYASAIATLATTHDPSEEAQAYESLVEARQRIVTAGYPPLPTEERPTEARDAALAATSA